jgi:hypothetical protein
MAKNKQKNMLPAKLSVPDFDIKPLMPKFNPSAQRCLTRFVTGDFAS